MNAELAEARQFIITALIDDGAYDVADRVAITDILAPALAARDRAVAQQALRDAADAYRYMSWVKTAGEVEAMLRERAADGPKDQR